MATKEYPIEPSTIETIDMAIYNLINDEFNLHTKTNKGYEKVPVIWLGAERSYQIKNNKELRDSVGKLRLPLISLMMRLTVVRTYTSLREDAHLLDMLRKKHAQVL